MKKLLTSIIVGIIFLSLAAQAQVTKTVCMPAFDRDELLVKDELLTRAKRLAVEELFGELVKSFTKVKNFSLQHDEIELYSAGFIHIEGDPEYFHGKNLGDVCVKITAYATEEDYQKLRPKELRKKICVLEGELKTIKERAENQAKLEALWDYDPGLKDYAIESVLPLMKEVTFSDGGFVPDTTTYCVQVNGNIYPIEVLAVKDVGSPALGTLSSEQTILYDFSTYQLGDSLPELGKNNVVMYNNDRLALTGCSNVASEISLESISVEEGSELEMKIDLQGWTYSLIFWNKTVPFITIEKNGNLVNIYFGDYSKQIWTVGSIQQEQPFAWEQDKPNTIKLTVSKEGFSRLFINGTFWGLQQMPSVTIDKATVSGIDRDMDYLYYLYVHSQKI